MLILNILYENKLYKAVTLVRRQAVQGEVVDSEVTRYAFGDPVLDWRLMRYTLTALKRDGVDVHRGSSCDKFVLDVRGYDYDDEDRLVRVGE